jgi:hypothetical protein
MRIIAAPLAWASIQVLFLVYSVSVYSQTLYGIEKDTGNLYRVSTTDASLAFVGSAVVGLGSLEYRPSDGMLYGITVGNLAALYRINPSTAQATLVGPIGATVSEGGLVIAPDGTAYAAQKGGGGGLSSATLFTIDLDTATTINVAQVSGGNDIDGLAWRSDNMLVGLDGSTNSLLTINPLTGASSVLAPVPTFIGLYGGMAAIGDTGFYCTSLSGLPFNVSGSNRLYSFNLFTGASVEI